MATDPSNPIVMDNDGSLWLNGRQGSGLLLLQLRREIENIKKWEVYPDGHGGYDLKITVESLDRENPIIKEFLQSISGADAEHDGIMTIPLHNLLMSLKVRDLKPTDGNPNSITVFYTDGTSLDIPMGGGGDSYVLRSGDVMMRNALEPNPRSNKMGNLVMRAAGEGEASPEHSYELPDGDGHATIGHEWANPLGILWKEAAAHIIQAVDSIFTEELPNVTEDTVIAISNASQMSTVPITDSVLTSEAVSIANNNQDQAGYYAKIFMQGYTWTYPPDIINRGMSIYDAVGPSQPPWHVAEGGSISITLSAKITQSEGNNINILKPTLILGYTTDQGQAVYQLFPMTQAQENSQDYYLLNNNQTDNGGVATRSVPVDAEANITGIIVGFSSKYKQQYYWAPEARVRYVDINGLMSGGGAASHRINLDLQSLRHCVRLKAGEEIVLEDSKGFATLDDILKACGLRQ
jgi:hypothetical protein